MDSSNSTGLGTHLSRSSTLSEYPSPTTPTFSIRGHSRLPSSNSSAPSSPNMRESIEAFGSASRPLTDVKEEPHDKDEDYQMVNGIEEHRISQGNWSPCHVLHKPCPCVNVVVSANHKVQTKPSQISPSKNGFSAELEVRIFPLRMTLKKIRWIVILRQTLGPRDDAPTALL